MGRFTVRIPLPMPPERLWDLHQDPAVLLRITPRFLGVRIEDPGARLGPDARFTIVLEPFRLGIRLRWETRIERYDPPYCFVDTQERGPFAHWRHVHRFEPHPGGSELVEEVEFASPFGVLGRTADRMVMERILRSLFHHRARAFARLAAEETAEPSGA